MLSETEVKPEITNIAMISSTDAPINITVNSRPYLPDTANCRLCLLLPTNSLIELTLDLLFNTMTEQEIIDRYTPFLLHEKDIPISSYYLRKHRKHSSMTYMLEEDRKRLEINHKQIKAEQKAIEKLKGEFRLDTAQVDAIKKAIQSFTTIEGIFESQKSELSELESGKLPDIMKDTHQSTDGDGNITTDALYPLIDRKRRQVIDTQKKITDLALRLAEVIQGTTKGTGGQVVSLAVDGIYTQMKLLGQGLGDYAKFGARLLHEFAPDNPDLQARWISETESYFQNNLFNPLVKIQDILRDLISTK